MENTIESKELTNIAMVEGNERKYTIIIDRGYVREWVGIGWITLRKANSTDRETYPSVVYPGDEE